MAESSSQVDSDPPSNPTKNGKRGAEEVVEPRVEGNKKHKIVEKNNSGMETVESSQAELPPSLKLAATTSKDAKKASNSNESRQEDEDDNTFKENAKHLETPNKSVELPLAINVAATTKDDAERASISNEYEEEDKANSFKEDQHLETQKKSVELPLAINVAATTKDDAERASISNEYEEEDKANSFKEDQHLETQKKSALKLNNDLLLDHPMRLDLATERDENCPTHDTGPKTLFLGNLSFSIEEDDVRDFFKNVGEIAEIRFAVKDDRFMGYGYIEFTTAEAAQEALKLNKEVLLDRGVNLDFARRQRGAYTPGNSVGKPNQRDDHAQMNTVYVRGFESSDGFDNIRSTLEKHFGKCGEISRLYIPKNYVSGAPTGVAFIDFTDSNGLCQALELDGSEVGGSRLTVEKAKRPKRDGREGSGYGGGGWSGSGSCWSGSGGGWSNSDGGRSGSGGGWSGSGGGRSGSGGGWGGSGGRSGSGGSWGGSGGSWSGSGGGWSGSGGGSVRESCYGRESGSGGGWRRGIGNGSSSHVESGYGSRSNTKSGPDNRWHRESGSGGGWHRESGYDGWGRVSGSSYDGRWGRGSGSNDGEFSSSRVGSGSGSRGNGYSSSSSHRGRGGSFFSGSYDSRRPSGP